MAEPIVLKVAEALQSDVGHGRARIDTATRNALNIEPGDIIQIHGTKETAAKVFRLIQEDEGSEVIRIDGLVRKNSGVSIGDKVQVFKGEMRDAEAVVIAPLISETHKIRFGPGIENFVKRGLLKRPLCKGDAIIVPGRVDFSDVSRSTIFVLENSSEGPVLIRGPTRYWPHTQLASEPIRQAKPP